MNLTTILSGNLRRGVLCSKWNSLGDFLATSCVRGAPLIIVNQAVLNRARDILKMGLASSGSAVKKPGGAIRKSFGEVERFKAVISSGIEAGSTPNTSNGDQRLTMGTPRIATAGSSRAVNIADFIDSPLCFSCVYK